MIKYVRKRIVKDECEDGYEVRYCQCQQQEIVGLFCLFGEGNNATQIANNSYDTKYGQDNLIHHMVHFVAVVQIL